MSRVFGVIACAIGILAPTWGGQVRSAPGPHAANAPRLAALPAMLPRTALPFVPAHARTQRRPKLTRPPEGPRKLVLTFDDGPDLLTTPPVLAALDQHNIKAAFFVAGRRLIGQSKEAQARRALLIDIAARGHLIANHTVRHKNLCDEPEAISEEIDHNQRILARLLGRPPELFRSPFGAQCAALDRALDDRGLVAVGWTIDPQDWRRQAPSEVVAYVRNRIESMTDNGVILLHDTHVTGVRALPMILDLIASERDKAARGEARPIEVLPPTALLPARVPEPVGLATALDEIAANFVVLPQPARR